MHQLIRFSLPDGSTAQPAQLIPGHLGELPLFSTPKLWTRSPGEYLFGQGLRWDQSGVYQLRTSFRKRTPLGIEVLQPIRLLACCPQGEAMLYCGDDHFLHLLPQCCSWVFLAEGTFTWWVEPGEFDLLLFVIPLEKLRGISAQQPIEELTPITTEHPAGCQLPDRMVIDGTVLEALASLNRIAPGGELMYLDFLHIKTCLLRAYLETIRNRHVTRHFLTYEDHAAMIQFYVIDHLSVPEKALLEVIKERFPGSKRTLERQFKKRTGYSPKVYIRKQRLRKTMYLLKHGDRKLREVLTLMNYEGKRSRLLASLKLYFSFPGVRHPDE